MTAHEPSGRSVPAQREDARTHAQQVYDTWSAFPIFVAALLWLVAAFFEFDPRLSSIYGREGRWLGIIVWALFALDLLVRFALDPAKRTFVRRNWLLVLALLVPPLRIIFVVVAIRRVHQDGNRLAKQVGLYALYGVATVVLLGALLTLTFEIDAPGADIDSFGDAVWWAFVTVTTVGYGDFTPVTERGRTVAVLIMFTGAAAVGTLTAALASRFSAAKAQRAEGAAAAGEVDSATELVALRGQVADLQAQMTALAAHLGAPVVPSVPPVAEASGTTPTRPGGE